MEVEEPQGGTEGTRASARGRRKRIAEWDAAVSLVELENLVEPVTRGDAESPLRWTCKSVRRLAEELGKQGHVISYPVVTELLREWGYSLQAKRKTTEDARRPDRNAQFEYTVEGVI